MLNGFSYLLCSKLCWHNRLVPNHRLHCRYVHTTKTQLGKCLPIRATIQSYPKQHIYMELSIMSRIWNSFFNSKAFNIKENIKCTFILFAHGAFHLPYCSITCIEKSVSHVYTYLQQVWRYLLRILIKSRVNY